MTELTGIDYSKSDFTHAQLDKFISQAKSKGYRPVIGLLTIIGGEPLLHPHLVEFVRRIREELIEPGFVKGMDLVTNGVIKPPAELESLVKIITFSTPEQKKEVHMCTFVTCEDLGYTGEPRRCKFARWCGPSLSYNGYAPCSSGSHVLRLWGWKDLFLQDLPGSVAEFPRPLEDVCKLCSYMAQEVFPPAPLERYFGRLILPTYQKQLEISRQNPVEFPLF